MQAYEIRFTLDQDVKLSMTLVYFDLVFQTYLISQLLLTFSFPAPGTKQKMAKLST